MEETGYTAKKFILWDSIQLHPKIDCTIHTFIAKDCKKVQKLKLDSGEKIRLKRFSFDEFLKVTTQKNLRDTEIALKIHQVTQNPKKLKEMKRLFLGQKMKYKNVEEKTIDIESVKYILGEGFSFFDKIIKNVHCGRKDCKGSSVVEIVDYTITVDHRGDIILRGFCKHCRGKVARVLETGEVEDKRKRAIEILENKRKVKQTIKV